MSSISFSERAFRSPLGSLAPSALSICFNDLQGGSLPVDEASQIIKSLDKYAERAGFRSFVGRWSFAQLAIVANFMSIYKPRDFVRMLDSSGISSLLASVSGSEEMSPSDLVRAVYRTPGDLGGLAVIGSPPDTRIAMWRVPSCVPDLFAGGMFSDGSVESMRIDLSDPSSVDAVLDVMVSDFNMVPSVPSVVGVSADKLLGAVLDDIGASLSRFGKGDPRIGDILPCMLSLRFINRDRFVFASDCGISDVSMPADLNDITSFSSCGVVPAGRFFVLWNSFGVLPAPCPLPAGELFVPSDEIPFQECEFVVLPSWIEKVRLTHNPACQSFFVVEENSLASAD